MSRETIVAVREVRMRLGQSLDSPQTYTDALRHGRMSAPSSPSPSSSPSTDWSYLHGRCFNLSLNLKILQGNGYADAGTAGKCYADLDVLEARLDVHWLGLAGATVAEDLKKAEEARRSAHLSANGFSTDRQTSPSSRCLKLPVRKLLKLSPIKSIRM